MNASSRVKIVVPLVSVMAVFALSAQAQEADKGHGPPPGKPAVQAPKAAVQAPKAAVQTPRTVQGTFQGRPPGAGPGRGPDARFARGAPPAHNFGGHAYRGHLAWEGGRWHHEIHNGRDGYWWDVGGVWYYYPQPMDGPPTYISEDYADDVPYADAAPVGAYEPPPPPPPDPAASAVGGAVVGGLLGGLLTGRASGAAAGAVIGGATGAIAGATAASQPGYYWAQGDCYYRYPSGQYVQADPRACY
ncbi:MAG: hypothetical protein E6G93_07490 [Alphaproteobacteria bacterium]|nr:MAG: hypothetical protein E6G93_07490 [Alphaproteobacteria bacterium]TMK52483.1 MAG: hypothetical protein E6G70_01285 [Alphaproteobacteria bacterium]